MTKVTIFQAMTSHPVFHLATIEDGKPMRDAGVFKDIYSDFIVYNLKNAKALVWSMQTTLVPKEYIDL